MRFSLSTGKRLRYFRTLRGMTQKQLGTAIGYPGQSADIRIAQYESGARKPKEDTVVRLSSFLGISPAALSVSQIDDETALLHLLFSLEDSLFELSESSKQPLLTVLTEWQRMAQKKKNGEITKAEYDEWRYHYPNGISF
ncbi:MAG TPA: helix-turn-helix transcriptional regulator [Clostridiales bacterium]|nr:helix-turn-helix transcriptional regulator [Clostridiales bacterium]